MLRESEEKTRYKPEAAYVLRAVERGMGEHQLEETFGLGTWQFGQKLKEQAVVVYSPAFRPEDSVFKAAILKTMEEMPVDSDPVIMKLDGVDFLDGGEIGPGEQWAAVIRRSKKLIPQWATALYAPFVSGLEARPVVWPGSGYFNHWALFGEGNGPLAEPETLCGQRIPGNRREEIERTLPGAANCLACTLAFERGLDALNLTELSIVYDASKTQDKPLGLQH